MNTCLARGVAMLVGFYLVGSACECARADAPAAKPSKPNIVFILSDDQAWGDYSFMGHPQIKTPHLDKLASESLTFTRGYVPSSLCRASLMTIITGLYPHQHGIAGNDPQKGVDRREMLKHVRAHKTLPKYLAEQGYVSFQSGKWWEGNFSEGGFTSGMTVGDPANGGRHGDVGLEIGRKGMQPVFEFLKSRGEKPFFLWYAPMLPHTPHNAPERLVAKYTKPGVPPLVAKYYANCEWFDDSCGELLKYLDEHGLRENTLVVYVTDNGWIQDPEKPNFAPRSKRSPNEGGIRTPIMVRWPGHIPPRRDETTLASSIDLVPTALAACGIAKPAGLPGTDLVALAAGKGPARTQLFGEIFQHDVPDIDNPAAGLLYRWTISGNQKLIVSRAGATELYDLKADPQELKNLAPDNAATVKTLRQQLDSWWAGK